MIRVVIAEDNYLVREGTRRLLEDTGEVEVVATANDAPSLLQLVEEHAPEVVLTDIRMPPGMHLDGIEAALSIRARHPDVGVVVLSQHLDEHYAFELFKNGTAGLAYLLKERVGDLDQLLRAIAEVQAGRAVLDADVVDALVARRTRPDSPPLGLTPRELDVLHHMAQGKANPTIAADLHLSESAIEKHVNSIFSKLHLREEPHLHRRVMAVLTYLRGQSGLGV